MAAVHNDMVEEESHMSPQDSHASIADSSQPNAGRIYDFLLGGNHNFEIDRLAAQNLLKAVPSMPQWVRLIRWFLGEAVRRLLDQGFTRFLDFASGLPTVDHIHQIAPRTTSVIYSDIDPVTVAYAQEVIKGFPQTAYVTCNAARPEDLLGQEVVGRLFGAERRLAIGFNGITWFLSDEQISHAMDVLYGWAAKGSALFLCETNIDVVTETSRQLDVFYKQVNSPIFRRSKSRLIELLGKWKLRDPGFLPLEEWLPIDKKRIQETAIREGGNLIGAIVEKA
jgi:hypothetical protein